MERIKLLIFTDDEVYNETLGQAIANMQRDFSVALPADRDKEEKIIEDALGKDGYDLILVDKVKKTGFINFQRDSDRIIGLTELPEEGEKRGWVYKYMPVPEIATRLRYIFGQITGKSCMISGLNDCCLVGFCSASGGVGKSALAMGTARELASVPGTEVLYLSAEHMESTEMYMGKGNGRTLGDYLYYLFSDREQNMATYLDSFVYRDDYGVEAIPPSGKWNELKGLNKEQLSRFLQSLTQYGRHRYICMDLDGDGTEETLYLMECCDLIFLIDDGGMLSRGKNRKMIEYLSFYSNADWDEKIIRVTNGKRQENGAITSDYFVEMDEESFILREDRIEIGINRNFGAGVKNLAGEIRRKA
ncbi:MAG: hypothetical protein ACOX4U_00245 [Anaerovoracaceae bacterium]